MVLVSFHKRFIYTKTVKTAGTSVEVFFEPYCLPPEEYEPTHYRGETITDYGVVGYRGVNRPADAQWYNHMPAAHIRKYLGDDVWNEFFKFCVVRNRYDKLLSMFLFQLDQPNKAYIETQDFSVLRHDFLDWIRRRRFVVDRNKYLIDGSVCVDYFIRFESLLDGLTEVCQRLGIQRDITELERFKSRTRLTDEHFSELYDREARQIVADSYAFELEHFGYRLLE
jgi:hypothetical protein